MGYKTKTIQLAGRLTESKDLQFTDAVLFETPRLPFAIVRYSLGGEVEEMGLRLAGVYWEAYSQAATALTGVSLRGRYSITHVR